MSQRTLGRRNRTLLLTALRDHIHGGAGPPIVLFHYAPGRGKEHPLKFLAGYRGRFLQCDAYQSYDALTRIARDAGPWQLAYCWTPSAAAS
jgi:transposase